MNRSEGYLVVLKNVADAGYTESFGYKGIDRLPPYPTDEETEAEALDAYVFGDFKNEDGLIPTLEAARILLKQFSGSLRKFEIIFCRVINNRRD
jgi:hypothetical protein